MPTHASVAAATERLPRVACPGKAPKRAPPDTRSSRSTLTSVLRSHQSAHRNCRLSPATGRSLRFTIGCRHSVRHDCSAR